MSLKLIETGAIHQAILLGMSCL